MTKRSGDEKTRLPTRKESILKKRKNLGWTEENKQLNQKRERKREINPKNPARGA